jgi:predicted aspartyl protease
MYTFIYDTDYTPSAPVADIQISSPQNPSLSITIQSALIDSGSDTTLLPINLLQQIHARVIETVNLIDINGTSTQGDLYRVVIQVGPHKIRTANAVARDVGSEVIIGRNVLNNLIVTLDGPAGVVEIPD